MTYSSITKASDGGARLPITRRAACGDLPPFRLSRRDREIIRAVYEYRALTTVQIERLFFPPVKRSSAASAEGGGKINPRCQHRLKMLYHHRFLFRDEQPQKLSEGRKPLVYFLDEAGAALLVEANHEAIDWAPDDNDVSWAFLQHQLATNDFRVTITAAARRRGVTIASWIDDKSLKSPHMKDYVVLKGPQGGTRQVAVVPDGFFILDTNDDKLYRCFLEIDRGTVTASYRDDGRRDWAHKVRAYLEYYSSGKYRARYGATGMRVLTVTTGARRLAHLKAVTEATGGKSRFWFATFGDLTVDTVLTEPVWRVASSSEPRTLIF